MKQLLDSAILLHYEREVNKISQPNKNIFTRMHASGQNEPSTLRAENSENFRSLKLNCLNCFKMIKANV